MAGPRVLRFECGLCGGGGLGPAYRSAAGGTEYLRIGVGVRLNAVAAEDARLISRVVVEFFVSFEIRL